MKCDFCGRELDDKVSECPYCHYQIKKDPKILSANERDDFDGITIEEDGTTSDSRSSKKSEESAQGTYNKEYRANPNFKVRTFNMRSGFLMTLLIIGGILALIFFLLPAFLMFAAIGAVVVFLLKLFM